jgi:hypothetical protein
MEVHWDSRFGLSIIPHVNHFQFPLCQRILYQIRLKPHKHWLAVEEINHRILPDPEPNIESCFNSITTVVARNSVAFPGNCITVAHLRASTLGKTILVPYYVHAIFDSRIFQVVPLESLVFEFESELESIHRSTCCRSQLRWVLLYQYIRSIGDSAVSPCRSLFHVHFRCQSSLWQLPSRTFSECNCLTAITIPASVRQIHNSAFQRCESPCSVTFLLVPIVGILHLKHLRTVLS